MAKKINWALSAIETTAVPGSLISGANKQILNQERWSEDFQDLSVYCNIGSKMTDNSAQLLGEQLNTPIITVQDEFDFNGGRNPSSGNLYDDVDPWGAQNDNKLNPHTQLWCTVSDWLSTSNNQQDINDQVDSIDVCVDIDESNFNNVIEDQPQLPQQQHLITSGRDYLLSQSSDYVQETLALNEVNRGQSHIDLMCDTLLKPEPQFYEKDNLKQPRQFFTLKNISNNNNNITVNMKNILDNSDCNNRKLPLKSQHQEQPRFVIDPSRAKLNTAFHNSKKSRDPSVSSNNLSSIFKSDEPLIGESSKRLSCITADICDNVVNRILSIKNPICDEMLVVPAELKETTSTGSNNIKPESRYVNSFSKIDSPSYSNNIGRVNSDNTTIEFVLSDSIKSEPIDNMDVEVETIDEHLTEPVIQRHPGKQFKTSPNLKRTGLKLDIDSAARLVTSTVSPLIITPSTSIAATCNIDTPEVLRPLLSSNGFDLLDYISGDGGSGRDVLNSPSVFTVNDFDPPASELKKNVAIIKPVLQPKLLKAVVVEKRESAYELPVLAVVKEEEETENKGYECEEYQSTFADDSISPSSNRPNSRRAVSKRKRILKKSEDMESDLSNLSDFMEEDDEKNDRTFTLSTPYRRKRTSSNTSRTSTEYFRSTERTSYGKQRKFSRDTDSSDHDSIASTVERYRELRDRNNEASRRSRLNRKSRETEMKLHAFKLEEENRRLKSKADEMEKLVKRLRESLMQLVLKKR